MDLIIFFWNFLFLFLFWLICFSFGRWKKEEDVYMKALKIFYEWKKEVWGVAYKWVWNIYEEWIGKKINALRNAKK
jgi:hypothetical protein